MPACRLASAVTVGFLAVTARADFVCRLLEPPGSTGSQAWQPNNVGQIPVTTDTAGYLYSAGAFNLLPPTPPGFGPAFALTTNDFGQLAGPVYPNDGTPEKSFILTSGNYAIFSYAGPLPATEVRGMNNRGIVTLTNWDPNTFLGTTVVYNPTGAAPWPAGFTPVPLAFPGDGTPSPRSLPGQMNDAGRFVGFARFPGHGDYGVVVDPSGLQEVFQVNGLRTHARGINNRGEISGFVFNAGVLSGFVRTASGDQLITCPELSGPGGVYVESLNDSGIMAGGIVDDAGNVHGVVVYPSLSSELTFLTNSLEEVGPGESIEAKASAAVAAFAQGNNSAACSDLRALVAELQAQAGKRVSAAVAATFTTEVQAIESSIGCR